MNAGSGLTELTFGDMEGFGWTAKNITLIEWLIFWSVDLFRTEKAFFIIAIILLARTLIIFSQERNWITCEIRTPREEEITQEDLITGIAF